MKTNISIELSDEQRSKLARAIDGKESKRLATRTEVVAIATAAVLDAVNRRPAAACVPDPDVRHQPGPASDPPGLAKETPRAVVEPAADIPCESPSTEKDFPAMVADWYTRAKQGDENIHTYIVWDAEKRGVKVK